MVNPFIRFILRRLGIMVLTFMVSLTLIFLLPRLIPGNPLALIIYQMTRGGMVSPEQLRDYERALTEQFQLNKPLHEQYLSFLVNIFRGDLGKSYLNYPKGVSELILERIPWTLLLLVPAVFSAWIIGNFVGVIAAMGRGRITDKVILTIFTIFQGVPPYIFGMFFLLFFSVYLRLFPPGGTWSATMIPSLSWSFLADFLYHYTLPFLSIFLSSLGGWGLSMRNIAIQEVASDYIDYVRITGLSRERIMRYIFKNSILPQLVGLAIVLGWSTAGSIITEAVFRYEGVGYLLYRAIQGQDYPMIQGIFLIVIGTLLLANFITEILFAIIDPRIRYAYTGE